MFAQSDCRLFKSIRKYEGKGACQSHSMRHFSNTWPGSQTATWSSLHLASSKGQTKPLRGQDVQKPTHLTEQKACSLFGCLINYQQPCSISPGTMLAAAGHSVKADLHCAQICSKIWPLPQRTGSSRLSRRREDNLHVFINLSSFFTSEWAYAHTYVSVYPEALSELLATYLLMGFTKTSSYWCCRPMSQQCSGGKATASLRGM